MAAPHFYDYRLRTADDLAFEPDDGFRREIYDGVMHVTPPPGGDHAWEVRRADRALSVNAPDNVHIYQNVGVHTGLHRYHVPDLTILQYGTLYQRYGYDAAGVLLVLEVVSPSSLVMDRSTKPAIYAQAGIPFFWRIDKGPRLQAYRLDPVTGEYALYVELGPGERASLTAPWPVTIDMAEFVPPERR